MKVRSHLLQQAEYPFVALEKRAAQLRAEGKEILELTIGDPGEPTYAPVRQKIAAEMETNTCSQYPNPAGHPDYRTAVANWAKENHGIDLAPQQNVLSCNGTKEAIFHTPLLWEWSGREEIFLPSLAYPVYEASAHVLKIPFRKLSLTREHHFLPNLDGISEEEWEKCQIFWLNTPHNPTSTVADRNYLARLLDLAEKHDFWVCSDECYGELYYEEKPASCLDFPDSKRWISFVSLSKRSHMTGYRMAAMISMDTELMRLMAKLRAPMGLDSPTFVQRGGIEAWNDSKHPRIHAEGYKQKRDVLIAALEGKGFQLFQPKATFYLWFSHPDLKTSEALSDWFLKAGILVTPGTAFGEDGEGYARIAYCGSLGTSQKAAEMIRNAS